MVMALRVKREHLLVLTCREAAMKLSRMDSQDCGVELCIHLAPKCIASLTLRGAEGEEEGGAGCWG